MKDVKDELYQRDYTPLMDTVAAEPRLAKRESSLTELLAQQNVTEELVSCLRNRLGPVSEGVPLNDVSQDTFPHIGTAVRNQRQLNDDLRTIIDTLLI